MCLGVGWGGHVDLPQRIIWSVVEQMFLEVGRDGLSCSPTLTVDWATTPPAKKKLVVALGRQRAERGGDTQGAVPLVWA